MHKRRWFLLITIVSLIAVLAIALRIKFSIPVSRLESRGIEFFVLNTEEVGWKAVEYAPIIGFELRYMQFCEAELIPIEGTPMPKEKITEDSPEKVFLCKYSGDVLPVGEETWLRSYNIVIIIDESVQDDEEVIILHMDVGELKSIPYA